MTSKTHGKRSQKYYLRLTGRKKTIEEIIVNGNSVKSEQNIANEFNIFFTNIGPNLANNINTNNKRTYSSYLTNASASNFYFSPISQDDVSKIIASLRYKSSFGHDGMSTKFLKTLVPVLLRPLTLIINQSLTTGIFPDQLKIAKVLPIHKKDETTAMDNYRPISLLPAISKVFEKAAHIQLSNYFTQNKLFYHSQYGFREDHSTELAALELVDRIHLDLDKRKYPIAIYMELSKAFDTLDHNILLNKLKYYGVKNTELSWFQSYLTERSQYVEINGITSNVLTISTGVPQGSILGPLLFLIYMNDIPEVSTFFKYILYADDTSLLNSLSISLNSYDPDMHTINIELSKIYDWLAVNKLSLNLRKTKYMLFHHQNKKLPNNISLQINSTEIERVTNFIFLGVTINEHLSWKPHIDKICSKISKYIGILNKLKHYLPQNILRILYCSVVQSHLSYAILTWGFDCGRVVKLQKKIIRIIACSRYNAHTEPIFKMLKLLKLRDIFNANIIKFYYKLKHGCLPSYFNSFRLTSQDQIHTYGTRHNYIIPANVTRTQFAQNCLRNKLPMVINSSDPNIIQKIDTHSYKGLSWYLKTITTRNYSFVCNIENCYTCTNDS